MNISRSSYKSNLAFFPHRQSDESLNCQICASFFRLEIPLSESLYSRRIPPRIFTLERGRERVFTRRGNSHVANDRRSHDHAKRLSSKQRLRRSLRPILCYRSTLFLPLHLSFSRDILVPNEILPS